MILHDGLLDIAVGKYRRDKHWKNKEILWSGLIQQLKKTTRTRETYLEYTKSKKERQDEIKDVGGFVGGFINGGRRKKNAVLHRSMLSLDIDFGTLEIWEDYVMTWGRAAVLYSTHKHSPDNPRLRLIIPLSRPVFSDEYTAIGRKVAGELDIEVFDPTTFEPSRLMYWPSTSKDGEYITKILDAPWMDPDEVLDMYKDWRDSSQWPVSEKQAKKLVRDIKQQADPTEKPGLIGAFCKAYTIQDAIDTFLSDIYEPAGENGDGVRYTYKPGSTTAGVVVYDDMYAYSHHGTDPAGGKLCNAFDLVRLHKFGLKDPEDAEFEDLKGGQLPSFKLMQEFAAKQSAVKETLITDRLTNAMSDFDDDYQIEEDGDNKQSLGQQQRKADSIQNSSKQKAKKNAVSTRKEDGEVLGEDSEESEPDGTEHTATTGELRKTKPGNRESIKPDTENLKDKKWYKKLDVNAKTGICLSTIHNVAVILENDPNLKGKFKYDEFKQQKILTGNIIWRKDPVTDLNREIRDDDEENLIKYIEHYGIKSRPDISTAFATHIRSHAFHPVRDYLERLTWDGTDRISRLFVEYLGAEESPYTITVTRKILVAAVARVFRPGCKFDNILVLVGKQGIGKSTLIKKLGRQWFSDSFSFSMIHSKEGAEQLMGAWLIEIGELAGMRKADIDIVKHFVGKAEDSFRPAYGRNKITLPRQSIFFASTNNMDFLRDPTGNRRFWPIQSQYAERTKDPFKDLNSDEVDQIWAQAVELYQDGETLHLDNYMESVANKVQKEHMEQDSKYGLIVEYLDTLLPTQWRQMSLNERRGWLQTKDDEDVISEKGSVERTKVCALEIYCELFGGTTKDMDRVKMREINDILRQVPGWKEEKKAAKFKIYGVQKLFAKIDNWVENLLNKVEK
jgi:predicted P-loop ATPase